MKAASKAAMSDAYGAIINSICTENGLNSQYVLDQAACAPASPTAAQHAIDVLEMTLATLDASVSARIVQASKRRNDLLPISQLPREMVVEIFHIALDSGALCPPTNISYLIRLKTLACVCSAWRRLVSGTPSLWAVLESTCPSDFLPTVIRKAQGSPLNIRCGGGFMYDYRENVPAFLCSIIPLADRWATLYLDPPASTQPPVHLLLEKSMPNIRKAWCKGNGGSVAQLFGGPTPRLKELRLHNVQIDWSFVELKDLSALVLVASQTPSISRLLATLERSPELELMELRDSTVGGTDVPSAPPSIILPHLKHLTLYNINHQVISSILRSVHTPKFRTFVVNPQTSHHDPDTPFPDLDPDLEHLVPAIQCAVTEGSVVELTISLNELHIAGDPNEARFWLRTCINGHRHLQSHFAWLQSNIDLGAESASCVRQAFMSFGWGTDPESSIYLKAFEWIPNVIELTISTNQETSGLIQSLAERICVGNKVEWRCPRLRRIRFYGVPTALEDVLDFARRRYGDRAKGDAITENGEITTYWPDPLEQINVRGVEDMDYETVEELKEITGCTDIVGFDEDHESGSPESWYEEDYAYPDEDSFDSTDSDDW